MKKETVYLKSLNGYNFRHNQENPKVVGFTMYTPQNLTPRPCFEVEYESDEKKDYIAYESVKNKEWEFV